MEAFTIEFSTKLSSVFHDWGGQRRQTGEGLPSGVVRYPFVSRLFLLQSTAPGRSPAAATKGCPPFQVSSMTGAAETAAARIQ